jgi:hypothetical protein
LRRHAPSPFHLDGNESIAPCKDEIDFAPGVRAPEVDLGAFGSKGGELAQLSGDPGLREPPCLALALDALPVVETGQVADGGGPC